MRVRRSTNSGKKTGANPKHGLARVLSKLGACSRAEASSLIRAGRVTVNGHSVHRPEQSVPQGAELQIDGQTVTTVERIYLALNKPRGLVTTSSDEKGRATVFECFAGTDLPHLSAVGRLDQASEGLLLFTNDTAWAAALTDPAQHVDKIYHVQIGVVADKDLLRKLEAGVTDEGEFLAVKHARLLRHGEHTSWLELTIDEGRNRHLRRLFAAFTIEVQRLIRVSIGPLALGDLAKGIWRKLTPAEVVGLRPGAKMPCIRGKNT